MNTSSASPIRKIRAIRGKKRDAIARRFVALVEETAAARRPLPGNSA